MKKNENLLIANEKIHEMLNLSFFPNFHKTGNIEGMRRLYYGELAEFVQSGDYIYAVDKDTYEDVKKLQPYQDLPQDQLLEKYMKEIRGQQEVTQTATVAADMNDNPILDVSEKISVVLQKFYSLHEAEELTRIILDPEKQVWNVKAAMETIQKQEETISEGETNLAKITSATFLLPNEKDVSLWVNIYGLQMPVKTLNETDASDIRNVLNGDRSNITEEEIQDMAKDLALTYYQDELQMTYDQLTGLTATNDITLTKDDARTFADFDKALEQKFPEGVTLHIPDMDTTDLYSYAMYNKFRDEDLTFDAIGQIPEIKEDYLQAEVRLPREKLHRLVPDVNEYSDETYEDFINSLDNADAYEANVTELMHRHPDLDGAQFTLYDHSLPKYLYIEGEHFSTSLAWMLQNPQIGTAELKTVLRDPVAAARMIDRILQTPISEEDQNRTAKMSMPKGLDMIKNAEYLYLFEKGTLGYARVNRMRGVTYSGETMSRTAQDYINDLASRKNLPGWHKNTFFMTPGIDSETRMYIDSSEGKLHKINTQPNVFGGQMYTDGITIVSDEKMKTMKDITGRITNAVVTGIEKPVVRCKVDGRQMIGVPLTKSEKSRMGTIRAGSEEMQSFALSMAVKHFANELLSDISRKQGRGL